MPLFTFPLFLCSRNGTKSKIEFYIVLEIKPFGLEFQNSRCLFTEFANLIHFGRKFFFCRKTLTQTLRQTDGNTHRRHRSNSSLDSWFFQRSFHYKVFHQKLLLNIKCMLNSFQFLSFMTSIYLLFFKLEVLFIKNDCL